MTAIDMPAVHIDRDRIIPWLQEYGVYVGVAALLVFNFVFTPNFLSVENFRTQAVQVTPVLILSLGMALVIATGGIDLSVGSVMALAAAMISLYLGYGPVVAILVALAAGAAAGAVNGALVAFAGVQAIVATLAMMIGGRGLSLVLLPQLEGIRNAGIRELGSGDVLGVPYLVWVSVALIAVVVFVVRRTVFGRRLVAIGGNRRASDLSGLPVRRTLLAVYMLCGLFAAVAGVLATARLQASDPNSLGRLIELSAITAVVVGGTPLHGGRVRIAGTVAGAVLMQLLVSTLIKHDLPPSWTQIAQTAVIIAAVYVARERGKR
ncbi:ABC transporter permease [Streptomonospora litoralis]|uniref:Ribose transport system permease protein RbsC n=1 Tax=Streptomonospora litoralis TaxID=2498135 RepID=A0A4P6Q6C3_9ACTN|nr:ABC transporter permease [Streptomonospora litoralis]QBI56316.1 Ribose transport system permease protein RbsC [Streptomonospora litoralis]